jgi:hypothetical protein
MKINTVIGDLGFMELSSRKDLLFYQFQPHEAREEKMH